MASIYNKQWIKDVINMTNITIVAICMVGPTAITWWSGVHEIHNTFSMIHYKKSHDCENPIQTSTYQEHISKTQKKTKPNIFNRHCSNVIIIVYLHKYISKLQAYNIE